jgi:phosphatidate cytidylyltransferase
MYADRLAITIILIPAAAWVVVLGGPIYTLFVVAMFVLAGREYARLFRASGGRPAEWLIVAGAAALTATAYLLWVDATLLLTALVLVSLVWHLVDYERGATASGTDFVATLGGILYLGWMGSYFVGVRMLAPDGLWWTLTILGAIWFADGGAYLVGRRWGRTLMAPRLSPKKTWEGFAGGVVFSLLGTFALSWLWSFAASPGGLVGPAAGALIALVISLIGTAGDLAISMIKRQTGLKDAGDLIAGHGGVLDRIDSWLVAIPAGYYVVTYILSNWT